MSLLVFGKTGQVGLYLQRQMGADAPYLILGRDRADLTDPQACADIILKTKPAVVINAAALNDAAQARSNEALATEINGVAPGYMARACAKIGVPLVHLSTAEVFDGSGEMPWRPTDEPKPLTALGRSKLAGEEAIRAAGGPHIILRSAWVISAQGDNFLKQLLARAAGQTALNMPRDQIGAPTSAHDLAMACQIAAMRIIEDRSLSGTYHYQSKPYVSMAEVARYVLSQAGLSCEVVDIESVTPPLNTRLDCTHTEHSLGLRTPDWQKAVQFILRDLA